ncbi:hypothetical protein OAB94_01895 [Flavobacteriaceae bacterium]|nr:hypothetical protein [Flavobacteriaceae bacterium]MDB9980487.1 hypothetical protein [bacterium]
MKNLTNLQSDLLKFAKAQNTFTCSPYTWKEFTELDVPKKIEGWIIKFDDTIHASRWACDIVYKGTQERAEKRTAWLNWNKYAHAEDLQSWGEFQDEWLNKG